MPGRRNTGRWRDIGAQFQNHADLVMDFGTGYMSFWGIGTFFAKALLLAMNWLHDVTRLGYGWVDCADHGPSAGDILAVDGGEHAFDETDAGAGAGNEGAQGKIQGRHAEIHPEAVGTLRKHKVSPMSGCLPMLIQMPVFFGFFTMMRSAIELRGAHFLWVADLSKPDTLFMIPGLNFPFNLLPLLMGGAMLWQSHLQPPSPGMDPAQAKMMRYLPLIFLVFLYNYSSGMALYMTVSTLMSMLQTKLTKMNQSSGRRPAANPALTPPSKKKK